MHLFILQRDMNERMLVIETTIILLEFMQEFYQILNHIPFLLSSPHASMDSCVLVCKYLKWCAKSCCRSLMVMLCYE